MKRKALTSQQVRERLRARGVTLAQWAREHNYRLVNVYRVMGGQYKGYFGQAYEIAVALGLKVAVDDESSDSTDEGNTRSRAAA